MTSPKFRLCSTVQAHHIYFSNLTVALCWRIFELDGRLNDSGIRILGSYIYI